MVLKLPEGRPAICAALLEHNVEDFLSAARQVEDADMMEIRADGLKIENATGQKYSSQVKKLLKNIRIQSGLPMLLTLRTEKEGGVFTGNENDRAQVIMDSMALADAVDIELRMDAMWRDKIIAEAKRKKITVIVSYHDFHKTPFLDAMRSIIDEMTEIGADIAKISVKANSRADIVKILNITQEMDKKIRIPLITISMGGIGKITRIAAPMLGSAVTYGYVTRETAPGQLSTTQLKEIFELLGVYDHGIGR